MRTCLALLAALLLAPPLLLAPAQGVQVAHAFCEGPACVAATTDGGNLAARACVEDASCADARACLRDVDCVAASACADGAGIPCVDARNCRAGEEGPDCALPTPCLLSARKAAAPQTPLDCIPSRSTPGVTACDGSRTEFTLRLFTGLAANGQGAPPGAQDLLWRASAYPPADYQPSILSGPAFSHGNQPISAWQDSLTASSWINADPAWGVGPYGDHVFQADYYLPSQAYDVTIQGRYAADNNVLVSDTDSWQSTLLGGSALDAFGFWTYLPQTDVDVLGLHTLTAKVHNRHASSYVGVNVQLEVHGYCKPKGPILGTEACTGHADHFRIELNTGVDPAGNPLPNNAPDPHWTLGGVGPTYSRGQNPLPNTWVSDPDSSWISAFTGLASYAGLSAPAGTYGYQVNYFLPANAYAVQVSGHAAADNSAILADTDIWQSTFVAQTPDPYGFKDWTWFNYTVPNLGYHTFSASVTNHGGPTALNVVAVVTGKCLKVIELPDDVKDVLPRGALP